MLAVHPQPSTSKPAMRIGVGSSSSAACSSAGTMAISPALVTPTSQIDNSLPKSIVVSCPIYGDFAITEAPLIDLLLSSPIQRLKLVLQHGITGLIGLTPSPAVTRYEHSVGAMLLVRQAGGTVEAQASALLHDVAHTALSHVVDGAFGYVVHEDDKMEYLNTTTVPAILRKHFASAEDVLEEKNYPLLELDAPAICADRLDYGIRDSHSFGFLSLDEARSIARDLRVSSQGKFCFASVRWAKCLAEAYMRSDAFAWANPQHSILYDYAARTIKQAHSRGLMKKSDLWIGGDALFWATMLASPDAETRRLAAQVTPEVHVSAVEEGDVLAEEDEYRETPKLRTIDPDVLVSQEEGEVRTLSELDEEYRESRQAYLSAKSGPKRYRVHRLVAR